MRSRTQAGQMLLALLLVSLETWYFQPICIQLTCLATADADIDGMRNNAYNKALSVKDEFFHVELYDWYLARGMTDQLLEVSLIRGHRLSIRHLADLLLTSPSVADSNALP